MGKTKKRPSYPQTLNKAVSNALVIFVWAYCTAADPKLEHLEELKRQITSVRESVLCGALTIPQLRKALKDEYNVEVI